MPTTRMCLVALCSLAGGCSGGVLPAIAIVIAVAIIAAIRSGVSLSQRKCPYCGHVGATPSYHEKGFVDAVTCDHCGREL